MLSNIQVGKRMKYATTNHGADAASNPMTRGVKSGFYVLLAFVALVEGCSVGPRYKAPTPTIRPFHHPAPIAVLAQAKATVPQLAIILEAQLNRLDVLMGVQPGTYAS